MADSDLLFATPSDGSPNLLFGAGGVGVNQHVTATLTDVFPPLAFEARAIPNTSATFNDTFPGMTFNAEGAYISRAARPLVLSATQPHQAATPTDTGITAPHQQAERIKPGATSAWEMAQRLPVAVENVHQVADMQIRMAGSSRWQSADALRNAFAARYQDTDRTVRSAVGSRFESATGVGAFRQARYQDTDRSSRHGYTSGYQTANKRLSQRFLRFGRGARRLVFDQSRYQEAIPPPAGMQPLPPSPPVNPPPLIYTANLLFAKLRDGSPALIFNDYGQSIVTPGATVVVPVRSVYMVINDVSLKRVSNNLSLPSASFSLKIDSGSWTWGFSASMPATVLDDLTPDAQGNPVVLEASVNGTPYHVVVESISRERSFASVPTISISGRGIAAYLDAPYAPVQTFTNTIDRTAQQLMTDVLTLNGISIGWTVDWQLSDWLVPAGAWSHQGNYISALKAIAEAAGGYILPHGRDPILRIKSTYPVAPWKWATDVTPDVQLPSSLTTREGIEWREKPRYNGVYVVGQAQGVLGHVVRDGTAGDMLAQMVVDPLITEAVAARQRGISILGDTGRIADVSLRVPVLPATGIIEPGTFIQYVDNGDEYLGIVRSTEIAVGFPEVFQSLGVETHVNA